MAALVALGVLVGPAAADAANQNVTFANGPARDNYSPSDILAQPGDTVTFTGSFSSHPLLWDESDFTRQATASTRTFTFPKPGRFSFVCEYHPEMRGVVRVAGNQFGATEFTASPAAPTPGARVTFTTAVADPGGSIARYQWDLDGDGTYETDTTAPTASRVYPAAGTFPVGLRYVDDGHETSPATVRPLVVGVRPPGGGTTGGGTAGGGQTPPGGGTGAVTGTDTTAPTAGLGGSRLRVGPGIVRVALRMREATRTGATLRIGKTTLGRAKTRRLMAGDEALNLRLTATGQRRLSKKGTVKATLVVTATDLAGNTSTTTRSVTVLTRA